MQDASRPDQVVLEFEDNDSMVNCAAKMFNELSIVDTEPVGLNRLSIPAYLIDDTNFAHILVQFRTATIHEDHHETHAFEEINNTDISPLKAMVKDSGNLIDGLKRQYFEKHGLT